jgi:hypothetical protein
MMASAITISGNLPKRGWAVRAGLCRFWRDWMGAYERCTVREVSGLKAMLPARAGLALRLPQSAANDSANSF